MQSLSVSSLLFVCGDLSGEIPLFQGAGEVPELKKMREVVMMLAGVWDAANRLPAGTERQDAIREIAGYQIRILAFVRRFTFAA